jgi:hypothetical protein
MCEHSETDKDAAIFDGLCPLCLAADLEKAQAEAMEQDNNMQIAHAEVQRIASELDTVSRTLTEKMTVLGPTPLEGYRAAGWHWLYRDIEENARFTIGQRKRAEAAEAEAARLREALEWYADIDNWDCFDGAVVSRAQVEAGTRARAALAAEVGNKP